MSLLDSYRNSANRRREEIAHITEQKAREYKKIADLNSKIQTATRSMNSSSSASTKQSRQNEIYRYHEDIARIERSVADFEHKLAQKNKELQIDLKRLSDEEIRETKRQYTEQANFQKRQLNTMDSMSRTLRNHESAIVQLQSLPEEIIVLFLAANPRDQASLSLDEEVRSIGEMISKARHRDSVSLQSRWAVRPGDILQAINETQPTIVHFSGHGSDTDELVLMDNNQKTKLVSLDAIVQAMSVANDNLRIVFFNTCFSENQAEKLVQYVEATIGMRRSISDEAARIFAAQFYSAIGFGLSIQKAFGQAKAALLLEGIPEEDTPALFTRVGVDPNEVFVVSTGAV